MIERLKDIVLEVSELIAHVETIRSSEISEKPGSANFVTQYDVAVQSALIEKLKKVVPGARFVGEEAAYADNTVTDGDVFIIDPIDGTTNFLCGLQYSGISVAWAKDGVLQAGVVYNPFRRELFWASAGGGAFLNDRPLHIRNRPLSAGVVNFGTAPYNAALRDDAFALAKAVSYHTMDLREFGSASLSLCDTAANRCVVYYSPQLCVWDYAAAQLIIEEAGGVLCRLDGRAPQYATHVEIVAGAPDAVREFRSIAEQLGQTTPYDA